MKKKIGFIDNYIDEWHANNYPSMIKEHGKGEFEIAMAWEKSSKTGGRDLAAWSKEFGVSPAGSIAEVVGKCDAICVLAPGNPELHEELADLPLKSGKPVYIDKPFAPDIATARRIFNLAEKHQTPVFSSSALRFASEILAAKSSLANEKIEFISVRGGGRSFEEYGIHQLEMLVSLMGTGIRRIMSCGNGISSRHIIVDYSDGRRATLTWMPNQNFGIAVVGEKTSIIPESLNNYFPNLIRALLEFFQTGIPPVPKEETIEIAAARSTCLAACQTPDKWFELEREMNSKEGDRLS